MTVKELVTVLLDFDMSKQISIEYPTDKGHIIGNYSRYAGTQEFDVNEYMHGVIIGVEHGNK